MKTQIKNVKVGNTVRFSILNKPEWNTNCNDGSSKLKEIAENRYYIFENGYVLDTYEENLPLRNADGSINLIID